MINKKLGFLSQANEVIFQTQSNTQQDCLFTKSTT
jgi:hypothetical protein